MDGSQSNPAAMAVLVDYESLPHDASVCNVVRELSQRGRSVVKRAYGDWSRRGSASRDLLRVGFDLIEMPVIPRGSTRIDVRMAIDAMELVYTKSYINMFAFVFGHSDYGQVARKLRELNCRVIFAAKSNQATAFANECCDEWIPLNGRSKCTQAKTTLNAKLGSEERSLPNHLLQAISSCLHFLHIGASQKTELVRLAQATRRLYPDIQLSELGFGKNSSWAKLIQIMEQDRWCEVEYDTTANMYFVQPTPKLLALSEHDNSAEDHSQLTSKTNSECSVADGQLIPDGETEGGSADCCHSVILPFASLKPEAE